MMRKDTQRLYLIHGLHKASPAKQRGTPPLAAKITAPKPFNLQSSGELALALRASEQRLSTFLEDRTRIGRDLHDCVLQSLYAIGLSLETSLRTTPDPLPETGRAGDRIADQINQLIGEIRRMIRGLEAGMVQEFDLVSELSSLSATYEQAGRLKIKLDLQPSAVEVLTSEEEREILNIVREALSNCVRHANATQANVSIRLRGTRMRVSIVDNGIGFSVKNHRPQGYGLVNMDARAKKLGGILRVRSKIGRGTHIITEFSLEPVLASV